MVNQWWQVTLFVNARGLTTELMPYGDGGVEMQFDFQRHVLDIATVSGDGAQVRLEPRSVSDFYAEVFARLAELGIDVEIYPVPVEVPVAIPFAEDNEHASYDGDAMHDFWRSLVSAQRVFTDFRSRFTGKVSPVHFFWGSFDLAVTRFSGRTASPPQGVTPNVASWVMAEAYSHEVSSCGFWPGNGGYGRAAFYVYAYPEPDGYGDVRLSTAEAFYDKSLGQFILPYDAVREASDPDGLLLGFLQETYEVVADLAQWDRTRLERRT
jgi:hypothetical protein